MRRAEEKMDPQVDYLRKLGYEARDVSLEALGKWLIALGIFIGGTALVTYGIFKLFVAPVVPGAEQSPGLTAPLPPPPAPNPALQPAPRLDLKKWREDEDAAMNSYGWVDRRKGIVRIPVERAMDLLAAGGLPVKQAPNKAPSADASAGGTAEASH
ncbi:MAG: hypothetical protein ACP5VE_06465 [Chthonomonadales bacterium]